MNFLFLLAALLCFLFAFFTNQWPDQKLIEAGLAFVVLAMMSGAAPAWPAWVPRPRWPRRKESA